MRNLPQTQARYRKTTRRSVCTDVSVVVCTKNVADMLVPCLESVKANHPKEVIVADGNSTDGTRKIAQRYADIIVKITSEPFLLFKIKVHS